MHMSSLGMSDGGSSLESRMPPQREVACNSDVISGDIQREMRESDQEASALERQYSTSRLGNGANDSKRDPDVLVQRNSETEDSGNVTDVVLDVPWVHVGVMSLEVNNLVTHLDLSAQVAQELAIFNVGADAGIEKVNLDIRDVDVKGLLCV